MVTIGIRRAAVWRHTGAGTNSNTGPLCGRQTNSLISVAVFNKSIEDEIFTLETLTTEQAFFGELETPGNDRAVFVRQPDNGGEATITGLEIGLIKDRLDFLPGPLATLGFSANLTFNSGDFDILDRDGSVLRTVNPEGLSEPITSATLYYEGDRFSARAAWRYASDQTQALFPWSHHGRKCRIQHRHPPGPTPSGAGW